MRRNGNGFKLALVLMSLCAAALGIAACGDGGSTGASSASTGDRGELSGELNIWDTEYQALPAYTEAVDQIDAEFEKLNPGVTIVREAQPFENYEAIVRAAFTSKEGPDIMLMQVGASGVLSFKQGFEVLNDQISSELQEELTEWGSATPGFTEEGDHYGVPFGTLGNVFYYNKKLFEKAGLPTEFEPESWAEIIDAGNKLKAAGIQPMASGNKEGTENNWVLSLAFGTEATPEQQAELREEKLPYNDEAFVNSYGPLFEMTEAGFYPGDRFSKGWIEGCAEFAEGDGAMIVGLSNAACHWGEFDPKLGEENVGFFLAPGSTVPINSAFVMSIPTFAENKDAALAFLEFEASKKGIETLVDVADFMPNRDDVSAPADAPKQAGEILEATRERESVVSPTAMFSGPVTYGPMITEVNEALQGRISLEDALDAMQETAEKSAGG